MLPLHERTCLDSLNMEENFTFAALFSFSAINFSRRDVMDERRKTKIFAMLLTRGSLRRRGSSTINQNDTAHGGKNKINRHLFLLKNDLNSSLPSLAPFNLFRFVFLLIRPGCTGARYHFLAEKLRLCFLDSHTHWYNENRW